MQKCFYTFLMISAFLLSSCSEDTQTNSIKFATAFSYPPFEFHEDGELKGLDIDLARLIAKELGKEAVFEKMPFSSILAAVETHKVDAAIATITITEKRQKNFDFSDIYYSAGLAIVYHKDKPLKTAASLHGKKVACELGTSTHIWLQKHAPKAVLITLDSNGQVIETLKAGHSDAALVDGAQGAVFCAKNPELSCSELAKSDSGYGIAMPKGSKLKDPINRALKLIEARGQLKQLKDKWLAGKQCNN